MSAVGIGLRKSVPAAITLRAPWAALLLMTMLAAVSTLLTSGFSAQEGEFIHALRSGEISTVAVGQKQDFSSGPGFSSATGGTDLAASWVNRFGLRRTAVLTDLATLPETGATGTSPRQPDPRGSIVATARRLGVVPPMIVAPGALPWDVVAARTEGLVPLMILIMVFGPRPRRTSRWGAFWAYSAPLYAGIVYALLRDSPWNPAMNRLPEPEAIDRVVVDPVTNEGIRRQGGWTMFAWLMIVANLAISVVLLALHWVLPTYLDPVGWDVVYLTGAQVPLL
jgi:hypothetical protein